MRESDSLTFALLPGFPRPECDGVHYEAEKAYVAEHGLPRPVLVDRAGVVWAGRTILNICFDLGIEPKIEVVEDGYAAAVQELATRDLTVLETADFVRAVHDSSMNFMLGEVSKRSFAVSGWFRVKLGKENGFSPCQVEHYLRVARSSPAQRAAIAKVTTLNQAMRVLRGLEPSESAVEQEFAAAQSVDEAACMGATTALMKLLVKMGLPRFTAEGLDHIQALHKELSMIIRDHHRPRRT